MYNFNLLAKLMVCSVISCFIWPLLISAEQVLFLPRTAPRYLKLVTFSNFWLFVLISAPMLFVLLVMILPFSMLISIPHALALSTSLLVRS